MHNVHVRTSSRKSLKFARSDGDLRIKINKSSKKLKFQTKLR